MLAKATNYILKEKGDEVISDRHQKDFKKEEETDEETKPTDSFTDISFDDI
jgi:hypothetical protein